MLNLFWADHFIVEDYKCFGEVVTFNTMYKTNKYHLSLRMFCGANHHKSTIIFAARFISKDDISSFVWLFREFLNYM